MLSQAPKGTNDILPGGTTREKIWDVHRWQHVEAAIRQISQQYGYSEHRPPVIEHTELFEHGSGTTTDIVQRQMFTILGRDEDQSRRYTMRPEFTPGLVRLYLENGLFNQIGPAKIWALGPCFRYENVQKGRYRQFHQWDIEVFGAQEPAVDAEVIYIGLDLAARLGLDRLSVNINSIGCPVCRPRYRELLQAHFRPHLTELCADCNRRIDTNPLRLLDCKEDARHPARKDAPSMLEHLCQECRTHFDGLQAELRALQVPYEIDSSIVRGLDYYTRTVFEVVDTVTAAAQSTVWGGGRYDGLIEMLGGRPTPGVGFALGVERLLLGLEQRGAAFPAPPRLDVFVVTLGEAAAAAGRRLLADLRRAGLAADMDYLGRKLNNQLRYGEKQRARFAAILGDEELARGVVALKDMDQRTQEEVPVAQLIHRVRT